MNNILNLSNKIYSYVNIRQTIKAYEGYAIIKLKSTENGWNLLFNSCKYDVNKTIQEFENYLICLEIRDDNN